MRFFFSQKKNLFLKTGNIYELFIESKKSDSLPKIIDLYLRNKKNRLYLIHFINHYFTSYEGDTQKIKEIKSYFNNDNYQNISNNSFVMAYLSKTLKKEEEMAVSNLNMYYPHMPRVLFPGKSKSNEISENLLLYNQDGKIGYSWLNYKQRLKYMHQYIEDCNFQIIDGIEGFEDYFELSPEIKKGVYLEKYTDFKVLYEKKCIHNILNKSKQEHILKTRL